MTTSEIWDEATAATFDEDAAAMFAPEVVTPCVDFLLHYAQGGPALAFAMGTGRIAIPLFERGLEVSGIELSPAMAARAREKIGQRTLPVTVGDMASTVVPGHFSLVFLLWNSLTNLRTQEAQVACFENAARHLAPGGRFVVEVFVPPLRRLPPGQVGVPFAISRDHTGFDTFDTVDQRCTSHHYTRDVDGVVHYSEGTFRYVWPAECDLMARLAGMTLEYRAQDWRGTPFTSESTHHVSVWRKEPSSDAAA